MSGQVGVNAAGELQQSFEEQAHQVWRNVVGILHDAGMTTADLVKTTAYVTNAEHLSAHRAIRNEHVGPARPAGTLLVVSRLGPPDALIEVEATAFRAALAATGTTTS
jgi:enamine deaminase RidA (YjgF/YER057c/UK114 family)